MDLFLVKTVLNLLLTVASFGAIWFQASVSNEKSPNKNGANLQEVVYRGAVLEMAPLYDPELGPVQNMLENVRVISQYASEAKEQGADIFVTPEFVICNNPPMNRPGMQPYTQYIPDPSLNESPCSWNTPYNHDEIVRNVSCIAKRLGMYVVVNLPERVDCNRANDANCPDDDFYFHNANVVFDRQGIVISKWRKLHLFREPFFNEGTGADVSAIFSTDFGVTFTQVICFDTIFYRPALSNVHNYGIKDIIMSTSWADYLPYTTAPQSHYGFSRTANANLLAAGRHMPLHGAIGSGIITAAVDLRDTLYVYDDTKGSQLLVQDIRTYPDPKLARRQSPRTAPRKQEIDSKYQESSFKVTDNHFFLKEDISGYFTEPLPKGSSGNISGVFVPEGGERGESIEYWLDWKLEGDGDYYLVLDSGPAGFGKFILYRQIAFIIYCPNGLESCVDVPVRKPTQATFLHLNLTLHFNAHQLYTSVINQDFALIGEDKWDYATWEDGEKYAASIVSKEPLDFVYSIAVIGRWYSRDPFCQEHPC